MDHTDDFMGWGEFPLGAKCKSTVVIGSTGMNGGVHTRYWNTRRRGIPDFTVGTVSTGPKVIVYFPPGFSTAL
ncbi:unnamed protein product [Aspergillus oryzae]|uniref:Unnamed protein product n=2 Tax=Aspergillus oryzae TaxID=5062 RepID=A0AAN5BZ31_ASPOZ|nr:unnamed protein product [Aspergillus oryzae]GMF84014.1 unnamed protein product [Aspergillus oryzae]GMG01490.1 unnamed protein product [Aspergillus oryzae]GMG31054.1 unnamed protein product [Aspergillus oryzae]GMG42519.1 unnamed protein product [Aspergillus oryzae var. brunneus]